MRVPPPFCHYLYNSNTHGVPRESSKAFLFSYIYIYLIKSTRPAHHLHLAICAVRGSDTRSYLAVEESSRDRHAYDRPVPPNYCI